MDPEVSNEAKRIEESAMCAAETQFEFSKTWRRADRILAAISAVLAAIAGVGSLSETVGPMGSGVVAIVAAGAAAIAASLGAPQTKERASTSANLYRALQQDTRVFRSVTGPRMNGDDAVSALLDLKARLQELNAHAELPSNRAWRTAKRQIEEGAQDFAVDL
jgi:hypothetical protein